MGLIGDGAIKPDEKAIRVAVAKKSCLVCKNHTIVSGGLSDCKVAGRKIFVDSGCGDWKATRSCLEILGGAK